jgi:hypothetical protein
MKALQSVLVFAFTSLACCGRLGGNECFSSTKLASLVVVVGGIILFGKSTAKTRVREGHSKKESNVEEGQL